MRFFNVDSFLVIGVGSVFSFRVCMRDGVIMLVSEVSSFLLWFRLCFM